MTPLYLKQISPMPPVEGKQDQSRFPPFIRPTDTSDPCPKILSSPQIQVTNARGHQLQEHLQEVVQEEHADHFVIEGSRDHPIPFPVREENQYGSSKWMSSKMRFMRKMITPDRVIARKPRRKKQLLLQDQQQPALETILRVCSDCNTTKTPLWRSGPSGPKSLCNACGIRQRKARRSMAAAALSGGLIPANVAPIKVRKEKRLDADRTVPFKKRSRFVSSETAQKKLCFDDIVISLSKSSAFQRVFPQDEKDAAILLMALSCGLICS